MAESATEKGVNEISAGVKNMDDEFTKDEHGVTKAAERTSTIGTSRKSGTSSNNTDRNAKRNAARKSKKKARQNK
jgi:hypothetical protein